MSYRLMWNVLKAILEYLLSLQDIVYWVGDYAYIKDISAATLYFLLDALKERKCCFSPTSQWYSDKHWLIDKTD